MSVNIKQNGVLTKISGLYQAVASALSSLTDVNISSPTNGQALVYNSTSSKWENGSAMVQVVDNLTTQDASKALSANQGYVLNNNISSLNIYLDETETLSTTTDTTFTFTDSKIHTTSTIDVFATILGMGVKTMVVSEGECTIVFPPYSSAMSMTCRIYIR